jgi:hypothetical protein
LSTVAREAAIGRSRRSSETATMSAKRRDTGGSARALPVASRHRSQQPRHERPEDAMRDRESGR